MFDLTQPMMKKVWQPYLGLPRKSDPIVSPGNLELIGDHQMGTRRMGDDPQTSVIDRFCRVHGVPNLYVVDSSFMPTGLGLNPMVSVVANALRVGSWIVQEAGKDAAVDNISSGCRSEELRCGRVIWAAAVEPQSIAGDDR